MNRLLLAKILFPLPVPEPFDYLVPKGMTLQTGSYVRAPLGAREAIGVIWALEEHEALPADRKLKQISFVFDTRPMSQEHRNFLEFVADFSCFVPGRVLRMSLAEPSALLPAPKRAVFSASHNKVERITPSRHKVLDCISDHSWSAAKLAKHAGVSVSVIAGLVKSGAITKTMQAGDPPFAEPQTDRKGMKLTPDQKTGAASLCHTVEEGAFAPVLLDGVTGSGKTEVYFEAVMAALRKDKHAQVLILLPEIALTQDVMMRFANRFGAKPASWHSDCTAAARRRVWRQVAAGQARIVVGARSALFLPFANLGLVIVDEEHDDSYKQDEGVLYHARNMAVARAKLAKCPVILASATPALESQYNARAGRYGHVVLPARPGSAVLPAINAVDLKAHPPLPGNWLSEPLVEAMRETLARKEQVLLYLNRRGFAPLTICRKCGERMKAPDSESYLVEHRRFGRLICHLTGYSQPKPDKCPACNAKDALHPVGPGVERLAEEVAARFTDARTEIFSSDTARSPMQVRALIERMVAGEIDIMIGTQMAAKGHNFTKLTLVGVVDADMGLSGSDLRAGERTWQTLIQVAGRAGRAKLPGRAMLQTYDPDHEALQALINNDRKSFVDGELGLREVMGFPPFGRLAAVILSSRNLNNLIAAAKEFASLAPTAKGVEIWGPSEPVFAMVRGRHRRRLLVRSAKNFDLSAYMRNWRDLANFSKEMRIAVDMDPYSFL